METILCGDALEQLRTLEPESVHTCVTSPPYYNLRDYGAAGQIGMESTPEEYIGKLVNVFREVRRVLRPDGTMWVNIGDCYATGTKAGRKQSKNPGVGANRPEAQNSVARMPWANINTFWSMEPLLEPVPMEDAEGLPQWVILGAETGNRKDKVIPSREWVDQITAFCAENEIPVFYKGNLREYFPDLPASVFPWEV